KKYFFEWFFPSCSKRHATTTCFETLRAEIEQRWGFMQPWCRVLHQKIKYKAEKREWDVWCEQKHRLEVKLPMRCQFTEDSDGEEIDFGHDFDLSWSGEECFQDKFIKTREALAFLVFGCCGSCGSKDLEISTCGTLWREIGQGGERKFCAAYPRRVLSDY
ncbi:hypothetical protein L917_09113, partial [Phytophthora nicotianae]